jgi:hypothetical protein
MGCKSLNGEFIVVFRQGGPTRLDRAGENFWGPAERWNAGHLLPRSEGRKTQAVHLFGEIADPKLLTPND